MKRELRLRRIFLFAGLVISSLTYLISCKPKEETSLKGQKTLRLEAEQRRFMEQYYRDILQLKPKSAEDHMSLGFAYYFFKQYDKARQHYLIARGMYEAEADYESVEEVDKYLSHLPN